MKEKREPNLMLTFNKQEWTSSWLIRSHQQTMQEQWNIQLWTYVERHWLIDWLVFNGTSTQKSQFVPTAGVSSVS